MNIYSGCIKISAMKLQKEYEYLFFHENLITILIIGLKMVEYFRQLFD